MKLYPILNTLGYAVCLLYYLAQLPRRAALKQSRLRLWAEAHRASGSGKWYHMDRFWLTAESILLFGCFWGISCLHVPFGDLVGTGANYFATLYTTPFALSILCLILGLSPLDELDIFAAGMPVTLIFVKLACFSAGCCEGIYWEHGFPNPYTGVLEFPVQLVESASALLLVLILRRIRTKLPRGTVYPVYMLLYCTCRFFSEFLRADPNVLGILKTYHILCLIGIAAGILGCFVLTRSFRNYDTAPA